MRRNGSCVSGSFCALHGAAGKFGTRRGQRQVQTTVVPCALPTRRTPRRSAGRDPRGPINGYVADRSLTGTKTNTPFNGTPQSISVVGREEIRDQKSK